MLYLTRSNAALLATAVSVAFLSGCAGEPVAGPVDYKPPPPSLPTDRATTKASFECGGALPAVHRQICASDELSRLDRQLLEQYRTRVQAADMAGALLLEASHRQWQLGRAGHCGLGQESGTEISADSQAIGCLEALYRQRSRELASWPVAQPQAQSKAHAYASYVSYRLADSRDPALCTAMTADLNADLARHGRPSAARLPSATLLAGTHADKTSATVNGSQVQVDVYNAGPYAGYENRTRVLIVNGQPVLGQHTMPQWIAEQPNYGGRSHASSSQTGDYGSIDVFSRNGRTLVMVNETWGFYSPAARGESAFSGLYELQGQSVQPLCLFQTYLTPPRTNTLAGMPSYAQLQAELDKLAGDPLPGYAQQERRDNFQTWKERQWTLLNLPLLGADALTRFGREAAVRQRNDVAMDAFFNWSERSLNNKAMYRRVMPMLQPAHNEVVQMFSAQGLTDSDARASADLLFHETFARATENLSAPDQAPGLPLPPGANYQPRYAIAPVAGELERGRNFATLYSVLINNGPQNVVRDFIAYETDTFGRQRGIGPDSSPALLAALETPANVRLLLDSGFDVNGANAWGKTPLMAAAQLNELESARLLLANGADGHRQTTQSPGMGVGGPDRKEAASGRQTALLMAAREAEAGMIATLLDAGAARQLWKGYHQQVCNALDANSRLGEGERAAFKEPLCKEVYKPLPVTQQKPVNIRAGDVLPLRDDGVIYEIRLVERPAMNLFGRAYNISPKRMRNDIGSIARTVGTAATRRGKVKIEGPLTLVFSDLSAVTPDNLPITVSFPVDASGVPSVSGFVMDKVDTQQVLSVDFDAQRNDVEGTWRALYSAALTQGFTPTSRGYVVVHTRGGLRTEYQLVVTE
jgi:uncharacterized protein YecT (DUF1311 family)